MGRDRVELRKIAFPMRVSEEMLFEMMACGDDRFKRRIERIDAVHPDEYDWKQYRKAVKLWNELQNNPHFQSMGCDCELEISEPTIKYEAVYGETHEEWLDRCRQMMKEFEDE